jgi:hypothetical protein
MEDPRELKNLLEFRMETRVKIDEGALSRFNEIVPRVPVIRSTEVAYIALERGLIEELAAGRREHCIESLLSALKFSGCSINWKEIDEYKKSVAA